MNSEELERSLKTEFESYLKGVLAEMRHEATEIQAAMQAGFDTQKSQFNEAFEGFTTRFDSDRVFDEAFASSVGQHLRFARDEGARIAADAMVEAENLGQSPLTPAPVPTKYDAIRDAVNDIGSKDSQSAILKSLVHHAADFAPRGAFFIIKAEHFSGWKVFGADEAAENAIRDIHFPVSADTIIGNAAASKSTIESPPNSNSSDGAFLNPLQFGEPDRMYAVPLVARGRGVAVLYADSGAETDDAAKVNREALETLVSVAGLTVELLASMQTAKAENRTVGAADFEDIPAQFTESSHPNETDPTPQFAAAVPEPVAETPELVNEFIEETREPVAFGTTEPGFDVAVRDTPAMFTEDPVKDEPTFEFSESDSFADALPQERPAPNPFDAEPTVFEQFGSVDDKVVAPPVADIEYSDNPFAEAPYAGQGAQGADDFQSPLTAFEPAAEPEVDTRGGELIFDTGRPADPPPVSVSPFDPPSEKYESAEVAGFGGFEQKSIEPIIDASVTTAPKPRLSDRNVDLPIEVPEDERRIHNDARRFARLLVSEIKLYNEKKVIEGRDANDLYDRLREAIDRSREMYDKRVQPPVAAKFDYFHYEIVSALADGEAGRLGAGYPGSAV